METATLRVTSGGSESAVEAGRSYVVGRSHAADMFIDDSRVSRRHLVIEPTDAGWAVRDVSSNGTWVNGQRVQTIHVDGQVHLRLGTPTGPEVVVTAGPPAVAPTAPLSVPMGATSGVWPGPAYEAPPLPIAATAVAPSRPVPPPAPSAARRDGGQDPRWTGHLTGRRRRRRWPWITIVALLLLAVAVDRIAVVVATHQVVDQVQTSEKLATKPSVKIGGFPFLTQVALGKYSDVRVTIRGLTTPGPRIDRIVAQLKGVHIPLRTALSGKVKNVPVDKISASVFVAFADLNEYMKGAPGGLQLGSNGSGIQLSGQIPGLDLALGTVISANIDVSANGFTIKPTSVGGLPLPGDLGTLGQLTTKIPVGVLPFNLQLVSLKVHPDGIEFTASATHVVLPGR